MSVTVISDETPQGGKRTVVFDVTFGERTERFSAVLDRKGIHPASGNFTVWATISHPASGKSYSDDFQFARESATQQRIVRIDGVPQMDNDQPAPLRTEQEARDLALARDRVLAMVNGLIGGLPNGARRTALEAAMLEELNARAVTLQTYYLPAGRTWKLETIPTLTAAEVIETIARASMRKLLRSEVGGSLGGDV